MDNENLKTFRAIGEYRMSEEDNFKTAKNFALDSASKNLDGAVKSFLCENFDNLDDSDIFDLSSRILKKDEPHFNFENLRGDEMICYAELNASINLHDLDNFNKDFKIYQLEKKIDKLSVKLFLFKENLLNILDYTEKIKFDSDNASAYYNRGCIFCELENYKQAAEDLEKAIELNPNNAGAYFDLGNAYYGLGKYDKALSEFEKYIQLTDSPQGLEMREKCYEGLEKQKQANEEMKKFFEEISETN